MENSKYAVMGFIIGVTTYILFYIGLQLYIFNSIILK